MLEGGGIEVNGRGLLLVTEEWLLSDVQVRNPGLDGATTTSRSSASGSASTDTIWLGEGCVGDDTHGHVDDIARFVGDDTVVLAVEDGSARTRTTRARSTTCADSKLASREPASGRCASSRCRFRGRS